MANAVREARLWPNVELTRLGLAAWSYGASSVILHHLLEPDAAAAVMFLDTAGQWTLENLAGSPRFDLSRWTAPLLVQSRRQMSSLADSISGDVTRIDYDHMGHGNFNAIEGLIPSVFGVDSVSSWVSPGPDGVKVYRDLVREAGKFFENQLVGASLHAPDEMSMSVETYVDVASRLLDDLMISDALEVLEHGIEVFPESRELAVALATAHVRLRDREAAIEAAQYCVDQLAPCPEGEALLRDLERVEW